MPNHDPDSPETPPSRLPIYDALPLRKQRFVDAYIDTGIGSEAARRAGYAAGTPQIAAASAGRQLASVTNQAAISEVRAAALDAARTGAADALVALAHVMHRPSDYGGGASVAAAAKVLDYATPSDAVGAQHLHVSVSAEQLRHVAQRLAAELGAPDDLEA